jgi:hypothetical protein
VESILCKISWDGWMWARGAPRVARPGRKGLLLGLYLDEIAPRLRPAMKLPKSQRRTGLRF